MPIDMDDSRSAEIPRSAPLSAIDSAAFLSAVIEATAVRQRFQFFSWTQGALQKLVPHGVLVCGLPRGTGSGMFFDYFHNLPLPTQTLSRLCHPRDGVAVGMLDAWRNLGGEPLVLRAGQSRTAQLYEQLRELGLDETLAHGIPFEQSSNGAHGFFAFVSLRGELGMRETSLVNMLTPFVFSSYCRALSRDRTSIRLPGTVSDSALSEREVEILHWVREGKSNHEIGMVLTISPLTVKNHIQRILKKLQASNRTQAVSKAMSMRLLGGAAEGSMAGAPVPPGSLSARLSSGNAPAEA